MGDIFSMHDKMCVPILVSGQSFLYIWRTADDDTGSSLQSTLLKCAIPFSWSANTTNGNIQYWKNILLNESGCRLFFNEKGHWAILQISSDLIVTLVRSGQWTEAPFASTQKVHYAIFEGHLYAAAASMEDGNIYKFDHDSFTWKCLIREKISFDSNKNAVVVGFGYLEHGIIFLLQNDGSVALMNTRYGHIYCKRQLSSKDSTNLTDFTGVVVIGEQVIISHYNRIYTISIELPLSCDLFSIVQCQLKNEVPEKAVTTVERVTVELKDLAHLSSIQGAFSKIEKVPFSNGTKSEREYFEEFEQLIQVDSKKKFLDPKKLSLFMNQLSEFPLEESVWRQYLTTLHWSAVTDLLRVLTLEDSAVTELIDKAWLRWSHWLLDTFYIRFLMANDTDHVHGSRSLLETESGCNNQTNSELTTLMLLTKLAELVQQKVELTMIAQECLVLLKSLFSSETTSFKKNTATTNTRDSGRKMGCATGKVPIHNATFSVETFALFSN